MISNPMNITGHFRKLRTNQRTNQKQRFGIVIKYFAIKA